MTDIEKKAYEVYPEYMDIEFNTEEYDINKQKREGYIKALTEIEGLPKFHGWVARDEDGDLRLFDNSNLSIAYDEDHNISYWTERFGRRGFGLDSKLFPNLKWGDNPIEVELIIRPI